MAALAVGCTPALTTMKPARITPPGHVQVTSSADLTLPSGELWDLAQGLRNLPPELDKLSLDEASALAEGAAALLTQPPGLGGTVSLAYGVSRRIEVGAGTSLNGLEAWTRWQFLRVRPGLYGALGLGLSSYFLGFPIARYSDRIHVRNYDRNQLSLPLQFGASGRRGHVWFGPKWVWSNYRTHVTACLDQINAGVCKRTGQLRMRGNASYWGGQLGGAVGQRRFWVMGELTLARVRADMGLDVEVDGVRKATRLRRGGLNVIPALGVLVWF